MSTTPVAVARERVGISVPALAAALAITQPACWDLLYHPSEVSMCLTLRQFVQMASILAVPAVSLVPDAPLSASVHHPLPELAEAILQFCVQRGFSAEQFGEHAGWDVQHFLEKPDSALDDWCLDTLRHVCHFGLALARFYSPCHASRLTNRWSQPLAAVKSTLNL